MPVEISTAAVAALLVFNVFYYVLPTALFYKYRKVEYLKVRDPSMTLLIPAILLLLSHSSIDDMAVQLKTCFMRNEIS